MNNANDVKLCSKFPNLYADRHGESSETLMCFGFECADGWYDIIHDLSEQLENLILNLPENDRVLFKAVQVKEKWGELRFYMTQGTDDMYNAIEVAEERSRRTCEKCGEPGSLHRPKPAGWVKTLCEKHIKEKE